MTSIAQEAPRSHEAAPPLLAWHWLWIALALFLLGTIATWTQALRPVPANRAASDLSFFWPNETNPHRRPPATNKTLTDEEVKLQISNDKKFRQHAARSVQSHLNAIRFQADGLHGWAVGDQGLILSTADGGKNWLQRQTGRPYDLDAIAISNDSRSVMAIATNGMSVMSEDNGRTWVESKLKPDTGSTSDKIGANTPGKWSIPPAFSEDVNQTLAEQVANSKEFGFAINMNMDKLRGWAVVDGSLIYATTDGGKKWMQAEHYSRSPALWYWLLVAVSAYCVWLSWHFRPKAQSSDSVADVAASDAEIRCPDDDKLDFSGLARGISRFLRNTETQPPLTLAITGEWGSGKSSLMQLVCADLKKYSHSPIWFNAWHHQKQENLFAGLLGAIHSQAAPSLLTLNGLQFRLHLLWIRSRRHFGAMMLAIIIASCLCSISYDSFQRGGIQHLLIILPDVQNVLAKHNIAILLDSIGGVIATFGAAFTALYGLTKGSKIFAANPATLMTDIRGSMSLKTAKEKNDFRDDFANQFGDLTKALPYRLVIVIDDLDRCQPAAILEVMETVNYLTSSGDCFVIFGMAKERVLAALGLAFKDIAAEMVAMDKHVSQDDHQDPLQDPVLIKRRAYAMDYLQKLVNIEIKVPATKDKPVHQLLFTKDIPNRRRIKEFFRLATFMWPIAAAIIAACIGLYFAKFIMNDEQYFKNKRVETRAAPAVQKASETMPAPASAAAIAPAPASAPAAETLPVPASVSGTSNQAASAETESTSWSAIYFWSGLALLPLLVLAAILLRLLLRKNILETRDSQQFRQALEIWTSVVATSRHTPRSIKRFGNRLRYLAMLQQGEAKDETILDQAKLALGKLLNRDKSDDDEQLLLKDALAEHQLIAIGAMHEVFGENWKNQLNGENAFVDGFNDVQSDAARARDAIIETAIWEHRNSFDDAWPPNDAELEVFERLISGVRLAGDPQIILPQRYEEKMEGSSPRSSSSSSSAA